MVYNYSKGDFNSLRTTLRCLPLLDIVENEHDVNTAWTKWKDAFLSAVDNFIPKSKMKSSYKPPYITHDIIHSLNKKAALRKRAKLTNSSELWERFRQLRRNIKSLIRSKKRDYIAKLGSVVKEKPKEFWRFFKAKTTGCSLPDTMQHNDQDITTAEDKAEAFNSYFASNFRPDSPISRSCSPSISIQSNLEFISVSSEDVSALLSSLKIDKATGPDEIPAMLLKECSNEIAPSLTALFNMSLSLGKVPQEWKEANVIPVPKKGDLHLVTNYRPISLLSLISKTLEKVVNMHVSNFVKPSLNKVQHGFCRKRSCTTQLLSVYHDVGKALDSGNEADMIYLDFSKAFDSVSHRKLVLKLEQHGISGSLLCWIVDYLNNRRQCVVINGVASSYLNVTSGVPQGSILGPLLFLIYANDLPDAANHSIVPMFADDSKCYREITKPQDRNLLQADLDSLQHWSTTWDLSFNAQKCAVMHFSRKKSPATQQEYYLDQRPIKFSTTQCDLGILVSDDLKWSLHINNLVSKANRMLWFLRRKCFHLADVNAQRLLYLSLVRSHLSHGCEVWAPQSPSSDMYRLESIQRRATKFILQDHDSSYSDRLMKLNLIPLSYWLELKDIVFFFKCKVGVYELDIQQFIEQPPHQSTRSSSGDFLCPNLCRTSLFRNSYFNRIVNIWNNLPNNIKSSSSLSILKANLYKYYINKLNTVFDTDRPRTWKTLCSKCRSLQTNCCS